MEGFYKIPDEIMIIIFKHLPLESILVCERVCKRWSHLARDGEVWNKMPIVYSMKVNEDRQLISSVLSSHCLLVRHLKLQYIDDYSVIVSILNHCRNITTLELSMCKIDAQFNEDLRSCPNLQILHFSITYPGNHFNCYNFFYHNNKKIISLAVPYFAMDANNFFSITKLKYLRCLNITKITTLTMDNMVLLLVVCKDRLSSLHIHGGNSISDNIVRLMSKCPLKKLSIIRCEHLTDTSLKYLSSLTNLEHIQLWNNYNFSEKALFNFFSNAFFFKVYFLSLSKVKNVTRAVVQVISDNYKKLIFVAFYQCPMIKDTSSVTYINECFPQLKVVVA